MSNFNRLVVSSFLALTALSSTGCGRRVPNTPKPEPSASAPTGTAPAPDQPAPAPTTAPPAPAQPPAPGPVTPPPGPVTPPPAPVNPPAPPDAPPPAPSNPAVEKFWAQMTAAGFGDQAVVTAELARTLNLKVTGWSKGKAETPDQNVEQMFALTKGLFAKPPADPAEYAGRSMAFATQPADGCTLLVDLKASTEHKNLFVLKHDPASKQIVGINEKDLAYDPGISAMSAVRRLDGAIEGKVFFYGEENGKFLDPARFVPVPVEVLNPPAVQAMRVRTPVYAAARTTPVYPYRR